MQVEVRESCRKLPGAPPPFRASSPPLFDHTYSQLSLSSSVSLGPSESSAFERALNSAVFLRLSRSSGQNSVHLTTPNPVSNTRKFIQLH